MFCCVSDNAMDNTISPEATRPNPALRKPWLGSGSPGGPPSPPKLSAVSPVHVEDFVGNGKERPKCGHPVKKRTVLGHPPFPTSIRTWPTTKLPLPPISHDPITCCRPMYYFVGHPSSSIKVPPAVSDDLELLLASTKCQMKSILKSFSPVPGRSQTALHRLLKCIIASSVATKVVYQVLEMTLVAFIALKCYSSVPSISQVFSQVSIWTCVDPAGKFRCKRCKNTSYCSLECQGKDWTVHRHICIPTDQEPAK